MPSPFQRIRTSLRLRVLFATVVLVALALLVAAFAFERVAHSVVMNALQSHLSARAKEVHEAVLRFQRERALTVREWAQAEAMQMTLDTGDQKFAEDYLRRVIQDQDGAIAAAALVTPAGNVVAIVRHAPGEKRGHIVEDARGSFIELAAVKKAQADVGIELAPLSAVVPGKREGLALVLAAPVKDFAGDLQGLVIAAIPPRAFSKLLQDINGQAGSYLPVVADREGRLVISVLDADPGLLRPVVSAAPAQSPGALEHIALTNGEPVLAVRTAAASEVPGWTAAMFVGEAEAAGRLLRLRGLLAGLFLLVLAFAAIAAVVTVRQASAPLSEVTTSMARVAGGDLTTRVRAEYSDELGELVRSFNTMVAEVERSRDELQRTEALRREVQIAHRIQTAILPVSPSVPGFEVAARMKTADDVGGDLYDILPFDDTFWVVVGDVSGHGINSGLVMMMAQAAAYAAIADSPGCSPGAVIAAVNRVVHENVRNRMGRDDYLTLMAARHMGDGRFVAAGAHQPVFVARRNGKVEVVEGKGPWVGLAPVAPGIEEYEFHVAPGETLCFITDGVVEAHDARGELFGEDRLVAVLGQTEGGSALNALGAIFAQVESFASETSDDMTAVVLRRKYEN